MAERFHGEYAPDRKAIHNRVRAEAGNRCIRCFHPEGDTPAVHVPCDERCTHPQDGKMRILTVHHLTGQKDDNRWWNLLALCQSCHLTIQGRERRKSAVRSKVSHDVFRRGPPAGGSLRTRKPTVSLRVHRRRVVLPNRFLEALLAAQLTATGLSIVLVVLRLTVGDGHQWVQISTKELARLAGFHNSGRFNRALTSVVKSGLVRRKWTSPLSYAIQADFAQWGKLSSTVASLELKWSQPLTALRRVTADRSAVVSPNRG